MDPKTVAARSLLALVLLFVVLLFLPLSTGSVLFVCALGGLLVILLVCHLLTGSLHWCRLSNLRQLSGRGCCSRLGCFGNCRRCRLTVCCRSSLHKLGSCGLL